MRAGNQSRMSSPSRTRIQSAFTLIELLVAIAVIGVLLGLVLAALAGAKSKAQQAACASNVRQLGLGLTLFVEASGVYPLHVNAFNGSYPEHYESWTATLDHELRSAANRSKKPFEEGVWHCPAAFAWSVFPTNGQYCSYGYNSFGIDDERAALGLGGERASARLHDLLSPPVRESEVIKPSEMMAIGEPDTGKLSFSRVDPVGLGHDKNAFARHGGRLNVLFCDGHVTPPSLQVLFRDNSDAALRRWNRDNQPHRDLLRP
jgi:prepilin-type processing-associated H-X9-DG protein/prepilin-type N-terminal cleavage/methylation domain-containing protein